jgi:hypothetical protein
VVAKADRSSCETGIARQLCFCVEFLQFWARQLVKNPNEVDVRETSGDVVSMLELPVAEEE